MLRSWLVPSVTATSLDAVLLMRSIPFHDATASSATAPDKARTGTGAGELVSAVSSVTRALTPPKFRLAPASSVTGDAELKLRVRSPASASAPTVMTTDSGRDAFTPAGNSALT